MLKYKLFSVFSFILFCTFANFNNLVIYDFPFPFLLICVRLSCSKNPFPVSSYDDARKKGSYINHPLGR